MAFEELTLESFIWENTTRAAHAVAPSLPPPPEERRPVRGIKPPERSKYHRRRLGTPPRRDAGCGSHWRFPRFRACARPSILGGDDVWRIDGLLTHKLYRNGCIRLQGGEVQSNFGQFDWRIISAREPPALGQFLADPALV